MNIKKILLTGGRAPVTLDLARKFNQSGHEVYVADSIKHHVCRYSNAVKKCFLVPSPAKETDAFIKALITLIKEHQIDLLIPTCEEIFYIASFLEEFNSLTKVFSDSIATLNDLHNKFTFNQLLKETGISIPQTFLIHSLEQYKELVKKENIQYPHVLKPAYSRFSAQTKILHSPEPIQIDISKERPWLIQEYISGDMICTYSICHQGKILANAFYKNDYTAGKNGAGISFREIRNDVLHQWISEFIKKMNYSGQIAFDIIQSNDGRLWPIECNPRATSGVHLFSHRIAEAFLLNPPIEALSAKKQPMLGLAMLIYGLPQIISLKRMNEWFNSFFNGKDVIFDWKDPLAFFGQFLSMIHFLKVSRKFGIGIMEATTEDIEWNGP